MKTRIIIDPEN